jgi:hypothetical protein
MAEVLCVCREVAVMKESESPPAEVAIISYDERPGIQAIGNTAPGLPPQPGTHATFARPRIQAPRHAQSAGRDRSADGSRTCPCRRSTPFARVRRLPPFLRQLDAAYPVDTAIRLILDNHSGRCLLATTPAHRLLYVKDPLSGERQSWPGP